MIKQKEYCPNPVLAGKLKPWAYILTVIILGAVVMMRRIRIDLPFDTHVLPPLYSVMNLITAAILIYALIKIRALEIEKHRAAILTAMATSAVFLIMYVLYHISTDPVSYCQEGWTRFVYYPLLILHIVAAAVIFPFILFTFIRGFTFQVPEHRKMARWVFPIWLFVTVSGPLTYLMLMPCY